MNSLCLYFDSEQRMVASDTCDFSRLRLYVNGKKIAYSAKGKKISLKKKPDLSKRIRAFYDEQEIEVVYRFITHKKAFEKVFRFEPERLGSFYEPHSTLFRVWAPLAVRAEVLIGEEILVMDEEENGTFSLEVPGDLEGKQYLYRVYRFNSVETTVDPFAWSSAKNGEASVVVDKRKFFHSFVRPTTPFTHPQDAVIYELHVRDFTSDTTLPKSKRGKLKGLIEKGMRLEEHTVGFDYLKELGFTHLQLLPVFDFKTVNEEDPKEYNWGYDPEQYNVVEGSYVDINDPYSRINDLAEAVAEFHAAGIRVTLDVVFNHVYSRKDFSLQKLLPYAFFRYDSKGKPADGSFCGSECRTNSLFFREYIVHMCNRYVDLFDIDGLRFDLMGLIDADTIRLIYQQLVTRKRDILLYGEGWKMSRVMPDKAMATMENCGSLELISFFNDRFRNPLRGPSFEHEKPGFIFNEQNLREETKAGMMANPELFVLPSQAIQYVECHDNRTFYDKAKLLSCDGDPEQIKAVCKLALGFVMLSQGIPFIHAGQEFLRSKKGVENSYNAPDNINRIDWLDRIRNDDVVDFFKELIALRREYPELRLKTYKEILQSVSFEDYYEMLIYRTGRLSVFFNPCAFNHIYPFEGKRKLIFQDGRRNEILGNAVEVPCYSFVILEDEG
ncbi:MAG: type I pullulanase [Erysipelotrichaceae bacterium]|nr:type I pullulanase [Erysipelotrichaceae bacterium]